MIDRTHLAILAACSALLSGCATVPASAPVPTLLPACGATDPVEFTPHPSFHDKFLGRYSHGDSLLEVSRADGRMLIGHPGQPANSIRPDGGRESWTFVDACGTYYDFVLPPDGPGAWLAIRLPDGSKTRWQRNR